MARSSSTSRASATSTCGIFSFRHLLREVYPYALTYSILELYADIRRQLRPPHGPGLIGDIDTLIAGTAIQRGLTLVTADTDFERVPSLDYRLVSVRG